MGNDDQGPSPGAPSPARLWSLGSLDDRLDCGELREIEAVRAGKSVSWP